MQLELNPELTAKSLLKDLIKEYPDQFNIKHLRTLQRRIAVWRKERIKINQERHYQSTFTDNSAINKYISLIANSVIR